MAASFPATPPAPRHRRVPGGELDDTDKGILSAANRISGLLGGAWEAAVVPGESVDDAGPFAPYGVPEIIVTSGVAEACRLPGPAG